MYELILATLVTPPMNKLYPLLVYLQLPAVR